MKCTYTCFQSEATGANKERKPTRRGRVLTITMYATETPKLLLLLYYYYREILERGLLQSTMHFNFNIDDLLENGRHLEVLRRTAVNRSKWRSGVEAIVEKERAR